MKTLQKMVLGLTVLGATSLLAADGAALYQKCAGCHGVNGEKAALGKSQIIKGWDVEKTVASLQGYKDGTYGGAMKGVMKGQVASMSAEDIQAVSEYIASK
jgi:cytochrome c553